VNSGVAISTTNLTRTFGKLLAVDHINLEVPEACIFGFLGPNGCGKSTTIRMLCGLLTPSEGEATVLGYDIRKEAEKLKREISYMTQRFSLYNSLSTMISLRWKTCASLVIFTSWIEQHEIRG
jgi:ABC-2 type transport system ATP-binding protein